MFFPLFFFFSFCFSFFFFFGEGGGGGKGAKRLKRRVVWIQGKETEKGTPVISTPPPQTPFPPYGEKKSGITFPF